MNEWLLGSLGLLAIWLVIFLLKSVFRKRMLLLSLVTMPFALTEPLFVPEYWNPPSLFDLAQTTGFDIESFIFVFAVSGIAAVLYESFISAKHKRMSKKEMQSPRHRFHLVALTTPIWASIPLYFMPWNPIYQSIISLWLGALATTWCRPDLNKKMFLSGVMFLALYFTFFLLMNLAFPNWVQQVWNFATISGILILGIPVEELLFAFAFGTYWSSFYEHVLWYKIRS